MIADPLTRLQCSSISDGAAAAVLGVAREHPRDVRVRGSALCSGGLWDYRTDHAWGYEIVARTTAQARERAPVRVTVVDRTNHHTFQPLLYQVAMA